MVLIWCWYGFGMVWYGVGMILAWCWYGFDMVSVWFGIVLVWFCYGVGGFGMVLIFGTV